MSTTDLEGVLDSAWARSQQRTGTVTRVRRTGFDAGFRAGYEQALMDVQDVEQGEMSPADLLTWPAEVTR